MIKDTIKTAPDRDSETILFAGDTPQKAYAKLTDAVCMAKGYDDYVGVDITRLASEQSREIGTATYDEEKEEVVNLDINQSVLDEYGAKY